MMGSLSYFVCATTSRVLQSKSGVAMKVTPSEGVEADDIHDTLVHSPSETSNTSDPVGDELTIEVARLSAHSKKILSDVYSADTMPHVVTLNQFGRAWRLEKMFGYLTYSNVQQWTAILQDLHVQHPCFVIRLHFWYEENLMFFLQVTPDATTSMNLVHANSCAQDRCSGSDCKDGVDYFFDPRTVARAMFEWQEYDDSTWPLEAAKEVARVVCEDTSLQREECCDVDEYTVAWDLTDCGSVNHRYLSVDKYLASVDDSCVCTQVPIFFNCIAPRGLF